jgi:hypothetical protein
MSIFSRLASDPTSPSSASVSMSLQSESSVLTDNTDFRPSSFKDMLSHKSIDSREN